MPNHVSTNLKISGSVKEVKRFIAAVKTEKEALDFSGVYPLPTELKGTTFPTKIQTVEEINLIMTKWVMDKKANKLNAWEKEGPIGIGVTQETHDALIKKYGFADWYNWTIANWGTKWGAYDSTEWTIESETKRKMVATISFNTAWSPATGFFEFASQEYPTLTFELEFADEGGGFVCTQSLKNGEVTEQEFEWDSEEGIEIRINVGYGPSEDEDEE